MWNRNNGSGEATELPQSDQPPLRLRGLVPLDLWPGLRKSRFDSCLLILSRFPKLTAFRAFTIIDHGSHPSSDLWNFLSSQVVSVLSPTPCKPLRQPPVINVIFKSASQKGYLNVLALLLNAGARMDLLNHNGETALARATRKGWAHCARLLLTYGANPQPMATDGHPLVVSPLHLARQMHQTAIEKDILTRSIAMENRMLEIVKATIPKHISLLEPGHLVDTKTSSFFPIQLISEEQLSRFVLYFKTPPGYEMVDVNNSLGVKGSSSSDELILVYVVRVQLLVSGFIVD
ncbi:multiple ankyrin repeats single kh domain protein [Clonorchis sinensis]|uniref:Multiple ankyrin repeats single kh domain protein n=1 Tax=Clonorchis sinensis TaxID=79923 RepID=G7YVW2_CLOSI|nr:multiple ankyrin repeats single kh domain protein [Clonorchis sinensis]